MRSEVANSAWLQWPIIKGTVALSVASLVAASSAWGQTSQSHLYPAKGQSQEQMQKDTAECRNIATQSTGYNPSTGQAAAATTSRPRGGRAHGAARGALAGAARAEVKGQQYEAYDNAPEELKQEYRQNQAGAGAYVGAAVGGSASRRQRRQQGQQQQSQQASFEQAYRSCMMGRGYTVQ